MVAILIFSLLYDFFGFQRKDTLAKDTLDKSSVKTARIVANGDILIHDVLYTSAEKADGIYDFNPYFEYVKDRISKADLAIGDYEGTISSEYPLAGYPLFNAPKEIARAIKNAGYDLVDLAHNHILDSGLAGAINTKKTFANLGIDSIGIYEKNRQKEDFLIKKVNGIKIAILGYSYGYNGMESNLTEEDYQKHMSDFDKDKMEAEIKKAEKLADITIVMPQSGIEYALEPTKEQKELYQSMVDWGADIILGGHPHVVEPAQIIKKDNTKKFIIYSMGNFISNQRYETVGDVWTERGLLMDMIIEKRGKKTLIKEVKAHPTMVVAKPKGIYSKEGYQLYNYRTLVLEDFIKGGKFRDKIDKDIQEKVDLAYQEMNDHVNLNW
ncbi:CapA family protein [Streptococcus didelphis]|uniref:CapA family protein n=1 Tax=Streptococcus didelphis TaxID=102886 RepID=UPI000689043E